MHLTPHMYKIFTLKANAKKIITWKCMWHHICAKPFLWRQIMRKSLLENAFDTTYVQKHYFEGKCSGNHHLKMHLTPHMYKKHYFEGECWENSYFKMHFTPHVYKNITLKANAKEIISWKCMRKLQQLHNTERPTKWSGHGKMIDLRRNSTYKRPFTWEGIYLVLE